MAKEWRLQIMDKQNQVKYFDERDTMTLRASLIEGTKAYNDYYQQHPERREMDDEIRANGGLMTMFSSFRIDEKEVENMASQKLIGLVSQLISTFPAIRPFMMNKMVGKLSGMIEKLPDEDRVIASVNNAMSTIPLFVEADKKKPSKKKVNVDPAKMSNLVKEVAKYYGASQVGIVKMKDYHYYTHNSDGRPVDQKYDYAIVYAKEMNKDLINRAPKTEEVLGAWNGYVDVAFIGSRLSSYVKSLGYDTFFNNVTSYNSPMVQLAEAAGIGQIGRSNLIVTKEYGNRVRLGAIMTNLPLEASQPIDFGMKEFCMLCGKCAKNCPTKAISNDSPQPINGLDVWEHDEAKCMLMWTRVGGDCGICMSSCPFSQGVDIEKINNMKGNPEIMKEIIREDFERYGKRAYIKDELPIANL
jgi:ferredoxin